MGDLAMRGAAQEHAPTVVKLGGSLLDLPDLATRLLQFLSNHPADRHLLVVGGGRAANIVRSLDTRHNLGDERAHWLAVRAMSFNARVVETVVEGSGVVQDLAGAGALWREGRLPILDPWEMLRESESNDAAGTGGPGFVLPHSWSVTSDSIAAWVARLVAASELVLLKSADLSGESASEGGLVDGFFPEASAGLASVGYVNLRSGSLRVKRLNHPEHMRGFRRSAEPAEDR